jgi:NAD-dependent deacetylase
MHGALCSALCATCGKRTSWEGDLPPGSECPTCLWPTLRPDIVFFGEMPYQMERIETAIAGADLFVSIGTSGAVYPAAGFVQTARYCGAKTLEINLEPTLGSTMFEETRTGRAGELVPAWVDELLQSAHSSPMSR